MRKDWIQAYTGGKIHVVALRPEEITISDIAAGLCHESRFNGQYAPNKFYSVAEHCVHVSRMCERKDALYGLLHDASEAYLKDIPSPLKHSPMMTQYRKLEAATQKKIFEKFGLTGVCPQSVHDADERLLAIEAHVLKRPIHPDWKINPVWTSDVPLYLGWPCEKAYDEFMKRFEELTVHDKHTVEELHR